MLPAWIVCQQPIPARLAAQPGMARLIRQLGTKISTMAPFDALADAVEEAVDMQQLEKVIWEN